jgi:DmsE family decaheme c-type cytochrome
MDRPTLIVALGLLLAALGFSTCAYAGNTTALPDLGGTRTLNTAQESLARDAVCTNCHDDEDNPALLTIQQSRHGMKADARAPSCQSCHGNSERHVKNPEGSSTRPSPEVVFGTKTKTKNASTGHVQSKACLGCHQAGKRGHWNGSQHQAQDLSCSSCHKAHAPTDAILSKATQSKVCESCHLEQRAQMLKSSHMPVREGKMGCVDCHNPHGSVGPKLLAGATVTEVCYTCHADKRGPFLFEHAPVRENCSNCHNPHGSNNPGMLASKGPFLCLSCHQFGGHPNLPRYNRVSSLTGQGCVNCHNRVHGSNHPSGSKFTR